MKIDTLYTVPTVPGYTFVEQISQGSRTEVYRALKEESHQPVVIKVLRHEHPSLEELVQFRNQYTIACELDHPAIVAPLTLENCSNGYALVMPDDGFVALPHYWQQQERSVADVLQVAIQLADGLHYLMTQRIIHKDIKPDNLLIHPETHQVQLIDFSIASRLPKDHQHLINPNVLEGTLAYLSPEQTGRMNRGIDYRTDFYSLGVTLFELLVGQLPFSTGDAMALVHRHMTTPAPAAHGLNLDVPPILSEIIIKLMAKNPEARYQSALGLKHDLERCQQEWQQKGNRIWFPLGERDVSDRFLIPEKLYGRYDEVMTLLDAFNRASGGASELMLVAGFSGIGKTAVINEVHKPITRQQGYFIAGKFDQFNRNVPFSGFVQAFRSLMSQLLGESDAVLSSWRTKILAAVGVNGQVINEVIPELAQIIGVQPAVPDLSGSAAQNRFNLLFRKFIQVFTTPEHPLVIFLDDLQWADSASLNLLKLLFGESESDHLLVLGAYRDNEVFPAHPLVLTLDEIKKRGTQTDTLTLTNLEQSDIINLVADTLLCSTEMASSLAELIYQKTQGNPFFTTQFLQELYAENCISFDVSAGYWQCDLMQVRQLALTDDVVDFMVSRLRKLPEATQTVLKVAACIGNRFDLATLTGVCDRAQDEVASDLWQSLQNGFVLPESDTYKFFQGGQLEQRDANNVDVSYRFLHDRIQQAAYALIPKDQTSVTHLRIGKSFLASTKTTDLDSQLFNIVNQLNMGIALIKDRRERLELAQLNLSAAQKAKKSTAYSAAIEYLKYGMGLLESESWDDAYNLKFNLCKECSELEYLQGDFKASETLAHQTLKQARSAVEKVSIYNLLIVQHTVTAKYEDALNEGKIALDLLEIQWDDTHLSRELDNELKAINLKLQGREIASLIDLPEIVIPEKRSAITVIHNLLPVAFSVNQDLWRVLVVKMVNLSLQYGHTSECCFGYSFYGVLVSAFLGDYKSGYEFGLLALKLSQKFDDLAQQAKASNILAAFLLQWRKHIRYCEDINNQGYLAGLESGQLQFIGYIAYNRILSIFHTGKNLSELSKDFATYLPVLEKIQHLYAYDITIGAQLAISNLMASRQDVRTDRADELSEVKHLERCHEHNSFPAICIYQILKAQVLYLLGQPEAALACLAIAQETFEFIAGHFIVVEYVYYSSLSLLAVSEKEPAGKQAEALKQVWENQDQLKVWAENAPENFQHKFDLVAAERHRVLDEKGAAIECYDRAIAGAKANGFIQEEAIANELAAKFYLNWDKAQLAAIYLQAAYYGYARWGASAKIEQLAANYPHLLEPILQRRLSPLSPIATVTSLTEITAPVQSTSQGTQTSDANLNDALDLTTILKASQAISSTLNLDDLLRQLTQIILQNSGSDRCAILLLTADDTLQVRATATVDASDLSVMALADTPHLPIQLIQYVKRTRAVVVLDSPASAQPVNDPYLDAWQPASVLCLPLLNCTQLRGVLYLENQVTHHVFHQARQVALNLLASQATIALENARLYHQSQAYAQQLEESQLQLVQSEKMSALGNLVAGVAHEINNPLAFVSGNIAEVRHALADLSICLQHYRSTFPEPGAALEGLLDELEIDFVLEDLPKMLDSMTVGCQRIRGISHSLRTFSRADTESKFKANVHEGLDSTLLILKYRLKANEVRPEIEVRREYGELPEIECFPGQLNQVFMNVLANAIDMFDEMAEGQSMAALKAKPPQIVINTRGLGAEGVEIRIGDNGEGMSEAVCEKVFDRKFTTKGVGKGTGLGLAIAQQVVVDKHGGHLAVVSKVGEGTEFVIRLPIKS